MGDNVFVDMTITRKYSLPDMAEELGCLMCDKGYLQREDIDWSAVAYLAQRIAEYLREEYKK